MAENLNLKTVETVDTRPFRKLVMTIGELPTSYIESMTYYELLTWFVNYLETVIIPTVNNNGEAVEELQEAFTTLKNFVDNYFDNLDVQEEINNKLDEMAKNGSLYSLINNEIFYDLNNRILANTTDITNLQTAQSQNVQKDETGVITMDMLTQNVKEALTGGSTAVVGRNSVGSENIADKAVSIIKLDNNIKNNFDIHTTKVNLGDGATGFYWVQGNTPGGNIRTSDTSGSLKKWEISLEVGKTYRYTGYNSDNSAGLIIGTEVGTPAIAYSPFNGDLNVGVYTTGVHAGINGTDLLFTVSESGLKAFITQFNDTKMADSHYPQLLGYTGGLYEVTDITPYDRTVTRSAWTSLTPTTTLTDKYMQFVGADETETASRNPYFIGSIADRPDFNINIFPIYKNHKYKAVGQQRYTNAGFALYDNSCKLSYVSMTETESDIDDFNYEFTASFDGFAIIQNANHLTATLYEATEEPDITYRLNGKVIAYNGDSITQSRLNQSSVAYNGGAFPKIISDITDSTYYNFANGGATLAYASSGAYHRICREIDDMNGNYDAIVFSGGINDYWQNIPLGTYTEGDYTGSINDGTICGGLESIFRQAINKWCGKPILFVITHKCKNTATTPNDAGYTFNDVYEKIVGICKKYSIPYYDCYNEGGLNGAISIMSSYFLTAGSSGAPDGTHPNEAGYKRYYVPQLIKLLEKNLPY